MLRSKLARSLMQVFANRSLSAKPRSRRLTRTQRCDGTEQLEVRQFLTGDFEWVQSFGGTSGEIAADVVTDGTGNIYTVGSFNGTVDFDPGAATTTLTALNNDFDAFVTKSDSAGNLIWAKALRGGYCSANSIALDSQGSLLITGIFDTVVDFDPGAGSAQRTSSGSHDAFVVKLSSAGDWQWVRTFGDAGYDSGNTIAVDSTNAVYLGGFFNGTVDFDPGSGNTFTSAPSGTDGFVLKLTSSGGFGWVRASIEANTADRVTDLAVAGGRVYAIGSNETQGGAQRLNVLALDRLSGGTVYYRKFSAIVSLGLGGIVVNADGSIVIAGNLAPHFVNGEVSPSSISFDGFTVAAPDQMSAAFLVNLDANGSVDWVKSMPGLFAEFTSIARAGNGDFHIAGTIRGSLDADPGPGVVSLESGKSEAFAAVYSEMGDLRWARSTSSNNSAPGTSATSVAILPNGNTIIAGTFSGTTDFDPAATVERTAAGTSDLFLWALSPDMRFTFGPGIVGDVLLKRNGGRIELWYKGPFTFGQYVLFEDGLLNGVRSIRITDNTSSNSVTVDYQSGGGFGIREGIHFGSVANNDVINLIGNDNEGITFAPGATTAQTGKVSAYGGDITFVAISDLVVRNFQHLSVEPRGSNDVINISPVNGFAQSMVSGTTSGTAITALTFDIVRDLTIDTGVSDAGLAQSNDTVTFNAGSYEAQGLKNVVVRTGKGDDALTANGPDIGLPVPGGAFSFFGGGGIDRLSARGNTNWNLNDTRLVSAGGGRILHDDIEKSTLIGGVGKNLLNASLFSGDATLNGLDDNDVLRGGSGNDFVLGGTGNDRIYGGSGDDNLQGQDGNDQIWGDAGEDTLKGGIGIDQLWGGDDEDSLSGEAGNDILHGGFGDDSLSGGDNNDKLFGDEGDDALNGDAGDDFLSGSTGDDALAGGIGVDLYELQGTSNAEDLRLQRVNATSAFFKRKPRGLSSLLEQDSITMDATDEFWVSALGGDDLITIDSLFTQLGSIDGGDGTDVCTGPAAWAKVSC